MSKISRRDLLKTGALAGITASVSGSEVSASEAKFAAKTMIGVPFERKDKVRFGIIGCGECGKWIEKRNTLV